MTPEFGIGTTSLQGCSSDNCWRDRSGRIGRETLGGGDAGSSSGAVDLLDR